MSSSTGSPSLPAAANAASGAEAALEDLDVYARRAAQRTRLVLVTAGPYAGNIVVLAAASALGTIAPLQVGVYALLAAAILTALMLFSRTPWGTSMSGENFTMLQVLAPTLPAAQCAFFMADAATRGAFLLTILTPLAFSITSLNTRRYVAIAAWYVVSYGLVVLAIHTWAPQRSQPGADLLLGFAMLLISFQVSLLGGHVYRLRGNLRQRSTELASALGRISEMAHRDELTTLPNRRALRGALTQRIAQAGATGTSVTVGLIDIDHFKQVNDRMGHDAGDTVLVRTAAAMAMATGAGDMVGRWGGEEFLLLMSDRDAEATELAGERLRAAIAATVLDEVAPGLRVTASLGLAQWDGSESAERLLGRADQALYLAKADGRNRVRTMAAVSQRQGQPEFAI